MEVCYLLLYGDLPNADQKRKFEHDITYHTMVHEQMHKFIEGLRRDAHPMAVMVGMVGALSAFYHDSTDITNPRHRMVASYRMIAKMPTLATWAYKYSIGQPFIYPRNDLRYSENFLHMMFATPCEPYKVNPVLARAMDRILILHADEAECLDFHGAAGRVQRRESVRLHCRWNRVAVGPAHGGANEAVLKMLEEIGDKSRVPEYIKRAKDKDDPFRLMGFGHRVYHNYDPRARIVRQSCHEVLDELGIRDEPLLDLAMELERIASRTTISSPKALPERRLLFRHHLQGDGDPRIDVHGAVRSCAYRRLGRTVERDDRRSYAENRPSPPTLHRPDLRGFKQLAQRG